MAIVKASNSLPATINELASFVLVGEEKLKAFQAKLRAVKTVRLAADIEKNTLMEGQRMGEAVISAKAKLGELLLEQKNQTHNIEFSEGSRLELSGSVSKLPDNVTKKYSHQAQTIAKNPHIVEKAKQEARERGFIATPQYVYKEIKREEAEQIIQQKTKTVKPPNGKYDVIVIDPPWPVEKIERDVRPNQHLIDYPTMTVDEIKKIQLPLEDNCHVFLWTTQKYLPESFNVLSEWNLKYVCCFVWHKPGGPQPFKLPQYNCEFVLYARSGSPFFTDLKSFNTCFNADRGKHSEKPLEFYETIRRVTHGNRLDMFSRRSIDGFDSWGQEAQ